MLVALFLALALAGSAHAQNSDTDSEPQPISRADSNHGGANGQCTEGGAEGDGPYCSTRDGSASKNGNGNGKATGKPCAGCVGKGNPAHTACTDDEPTTSDEPDDADEDETGKPEEPGNPGQPGDTDESADVTGPDAAPVVAGVELEAQPNTSQAATVAAAQTARTASMGLPQTGASDSLLMLLLAGLAMAGIGGTTMVYRRRTATNS